MAAGANGKRRLSRSKTKLILFGIEIVIILIMLTVLYLVMHKSSDGPKMAELDPQVLEIHENVQQLKEEGGAMQGYRNIALFGLDAENDSQLYKSSHSDSIMIASVNMDTGDIRLVSVYRDTYLNLGNDDYWKATQAYFSGGAEQAVKMLNMNLDMDITDFVAVGYKGLRNVVDGLGGIYINVENEEIVHHLNNYQIGISNVLQCDYTPVTEPGYQLLNGMQATAYCRIRYGGGDDYKRTARQREVLMALEEQAKKTDLVTLTKVFNDCIGDIYTSLDSGDILDLLADIGKYSIVEQNAIPQEGMRTVGNIGAKGSCIVPKSLEDNVVWLHEFLFGDENYTVTENVKEYENKIKADTEAYLTE